LVRGTLACKQPIVHMISNTPNNIPDGELTVFAQAMPDEFKQENAVKAYRAYYHSKMYSAGGVHYRHTSPPDWWMGVTA
jgi:hypothetical protein